MIFRTLLFAVFLVVSQPLMGHNYIFNRLTISDGLLSNNVLSIWQDSTGYLWIGTQSGLQRFDGLTMRTVLTERVDQILPDGPETLWIRSGSRVGILNTNNFSIRYLTYEGEQTVYGTYKIWLRKDPEGHVFLVHRGYNCQSPDPAKQTFSRSANPFQLPDSLQITDIVPDPGKKRYWVLSRNDLGYWDYLSRKYYSRSAQPVSDPLLANRDLPKTVNRLFIDTKSRYWMTAENAGQTQILCFDSNRRAFTRDTLRAHVSDPADIYEIYGFAAYEDTITLAYGVNYFRGHHGQSFLDLKSPLSNPYGIFFNSIAGIFEDREGFMWVATDNGLYYTAGNRNKYTHLFISQQKKRSAISDLLADRQKRLWIATWGRGAFLLSNDMNGTQVVPVEVLEKLGAPMQRILSLCEDTRGTIWVGADQGYIASYRPGAPSASLYCPKIFARNMVSQIVADQAGYLWIGLQNGSIWRYRTSVPFTEKALEKVIEAGGPVSKILFFDANTLWIAVTGKGILVIDRRTFRTIRNIGIPEGSRLIAGVRDMIVYSDTLVYLAGERLGTLNPKTWQVNFNLPYMDRSSANLFTLQKDSLQHLWMGGAEGISMLDPSKGIVTRYSQQDGLLTVHNNSYVPERSTSLPYGKLAFAGNQHLVIFNPVEYHSAPPPPDVTITGFQLNNQYLSLDSLVKEKVITLPYTHNSFRIDFAAMSFLHRDRIIYEYKMEGVDKDWLPATDPGHVSYHLLPDGRYRFWVRAKNHQGEYSYHATYLDFRIRPPFWKSMWFFLLLAILIGAILYYLHRLRLERLLHIEKVRNRLARDLHDDMGSTLSTINILSEIALQQKSYDESKNRQYLTTISQSTHRMMEAMDDIVWSINPVNDSMARVIARMKETAASVLEPQEIDYHFEVESSVLELYLPMETRREIFLIFKEALNNSLKYARCNMITVSLSGNRSELILTIADNGIGFTMPDNNSTVRGNGLRNMHSRAANLKGRLTISSQPEQGTSVKLVIPIA